MSVNEMLMAAAGTAGGAPLYVDDVYSTFLYTGNGSTQTITNGIDLAGKGGLVWIKRRDNSISHALFDTQRGATKYLSSDLTNAEATNALTLTSFNSNGFSLNQTGITNQNAGTFASWTFRKAPKFFDVVTWTGNDTARTIAHNLGSTPGMIIVKRTDSTGAWLVYHRSVGATKYLLLNSNAAQATISTIWNDTEPTSTVFTVGDASAVNASGGTYVAYLFAHNAGGFGDAGTDNIISCGSFTTNSSGNFSVNLGYEPQYILLKRTNTTGYWIVHDVMRGLSYTRLEYLYPALSDAEIAATDGRLVVNATGFSNNGVNFGAGDTYVYMAIRRPMKTPTTGTSVFNPAIGNNITATGQTIFQAGFPVDMFIEGWRGGFSARYTYDRLRGTSQLDTSSNGAEIPNDTYRSLASNTAVLSGTSFYNFSDIVGWCFRRAPGFFDIVCYTGTGYTTTNNVTHNLGVTPELYIVKNRNSSGENWFVWHSLLNATSGEYLILDGTNAKGTFAALWGGSPTATTFAVKGDSGVNFSGYTYVAYLFATLAGVSKVGSYTGNGTNQTINCGFSAGARFVMIKRTDSTGNWCVFDTARGIVSGNDPFMGLNGSTEVTNQDAVDPVSSGFIVNQTTENLNVNNATYIYLAIA